MTAGAGDQAILDPPGDGEPRRRGRRPAGEDTRGAILVAARAEFAARGYDGATLRGIARAAGVDPRLVHHYFDGKDDVFAAVMSLPLRPADLVHAVVDAGPDGVGERLVRFFFGTWDSPHGREVLTGLLRSALTHQDAADILRQFLATALLGRIAAVLEVQDAELRASLAISQLVGVAVLRYVVRIEPVASADVDDLVVLLAPTLQRYLTG